MALKFRRAALTDRWRNRRAADCQFAEPAFKSQQDELQLTSNNVLKLAPLDVRRAPGFISSTYDARDTTTQRKMIIAQWREERRAKDLTKFKMDAQSYEDCRKKVREAPMFKRQQVKIYEIREKSRTRPLTPNSERRPVVIHIIELT